MARSDRDDIEARANWLKRAAAYGDGSRLASQKCEDMVARRILLGLGFRESGLADLERSLGLPSDWARTLLDRTLDVVGAVSGGMFAPGSGRMALVARNGDTRHNVVLGDIDGTVDSASSTPDGLLVLARVGDTRTAWAYAVVPEDFLPAWLLQPPAVLLAKHGGYSVWYREVSDMFHDMAEYLRWDVPRT